MVFFKMAMLNSDVTRQFVLAFSMTEVLLWREGSIYCVLTGRFFWLSALSMKSHLIL